MSLRKRRNLVLLAVIHLLVLAAFLPGCKEGTKTTPASALLTIQEHAEIDLSSGEDSIHTLTGSVVSASNSIQIGDVSVSLYFENKLAAITKTTSDGSFYFSKLPPGIFDLIFSKANYLVASYVVRIMDDGTSSPSNPQVLLTSIGTEPTKATIEGVVSLSGTNQPLANLNVELFNKLTPGYIFKNSLTNSLGKFSFNEIPVGSYIVSIAENSVYEERKQDFEVRADGLVSPKLAMISLDPKPLASISLDITGYVKTGSNESSPIFEVSIYKDYQAKSLLTDLKSANPIYTTGEGKFFFTGIEEPGLYFLVASAASFKTSDTYAFQILADGSTSPKEIIVPIIRDGLDKKFTITGTITDAFSGGPIEYAKIKLGDFNQAMTDLKGTFTVDVLKGTYNIEISKFGYDTLSTSILVTENATTTYAMLHSLKTGYGSIAGRICDDNGEGLATASVYLYKMVQTTRSYWYSYYNASETWFVSDQLREITKWECESKNPVLKTKTGDKNDDSPPEFKGSFKFTHIEPGYYLAYITKLSTPPVIDLFSNNEYEKLVFVEWLLPNTASRPADIVIEKLKVEEGKTTYWTNYEQTYEN